MAALKLEPDLQSRHARGAQQHRIYSKDWTESLARGRCSDATEGVVSFLEKTPASVRRFGVVGDAALLSMVEA
jgi:hypothetical protein